MFKAVHLLNIFTVYQNPPINNAQTQQTPKMPNPLSNSNPSVNHKSVQKISQHYKYHNSFIKK